MLYMVIERFKEGAAPEIYRRFREKGRMMPEGLKYVSSWIDLDFKVCYQLIETEEIDTLRRYYEHENANVHRGLHTLSSRATEAYEKARQRVADYIGAASADEIVFTRGTTESINLVAQAWGGKFIREGDVILLTVMEHHSNLVPWQLLAERTRAQLRFVPVRDDGTLELEQLSSLLTPEVKLFAFTHVSNSLGTINPIAAIYEHDSQLAHYAAERLTELPGTRVFGPKEERGALAGFVMDAAHPHDLTTFADQYGLAMRGGHHCNQPLMRRFGVSGTTRASFYFYNTMEEIDRMIEILHRAVRFFSPKEARPPVRPLS